MNAWEKQLQSWTPRRPSAKVAARIFGRAEKAPELLRRAELWNWLTPVAACCLAMVVALGGSRYRAAHFDEATDATLIAAVALSGASNFQPALPVGQFDPNMQWNVWDRISSARLTNRSYPMGGLETWRSAATNH